MVNKNLNNKIAIMFSVLCLLIMLAMTTINAEIQITQTNVVHPETNTAEIVSNYIFDDTSPTGTGNWLYDRISLFVIEDQNLPSVNIGHNGHSYIMDYCNLSITNSSSNYSSEQTFIDTVGNIGAILLNQNVGNINQSFNSGYINYRQDFFIYNKDSVRVSFSCHTNDSTTLNDLFSDMDVLMSMTSYSCNQCNYKTFQQAINQSNSVSMYDNFQKVVSYNWEIWLIFDWIIRIAFILLAVFLIFSGGYFLYKFVENLGKVIR